MTEITVSVRRCFCRGMKITSPQKARTEGFSLFDLAARPAHATHLVATRLQSDPEAFAVGVAFAVAVADWRSWLATERWRPLIGWLELYG
ncbi:MAG: hypothetical protein IPK22_26145 [Verrucomicrobiaceae bacterium]|nr:hypothetical protein [Verrucomicrobiaceae bacterium]